MAKFDYGDAAVAAIEQEFRKAIAEALKILRVNDIDTEAVRKAVQTVARSHPILQKRFDELFYKVLGIARFNAQAASEEGFSTAVQEITNDLEKELEKVAKDSLFKPKSRKSTGSDRFDAAGNQLEGAVGPGLRFSLNTNPPDESNIRAAEYLLANPDEFKLTSLYARLNANSIRTLEDEFLRAVREGVNPLELARRLRAALDFNKAQAKTLARTMIMQAHRQAMHTVMNQNQDVLEEWEWIAHLDDKTCAVCWGMNGTRHPLKEKMESHPNCRCIQKPITKTAEQLGWKEPTNKSIADRRVEERDAMRMTDERFAAMSDARKKVILGNGRFKLYSYGEYSLSDFVKATNYFTYGPGLMVKSLRSLGYDPKQQFDIARSWKDVRETIQRRYERGEIGRTRVRHALSSIASAVKSGDPVPPKPPTHPT